MVKVSFKDNPMPIPTLRGCLL